MTEGLTLTRHRRSRPPACHLSDQDDADGIAQDFYFIKWKVLSNLLNYFSIQTKPNMCISTCLLMIVYTCQMEVSDPTQTHNMVLTANFVMPLTKFGECPSADLRNGSFEDDGRTDLYICGQELFDIPICITQQSAR